MCRHPNVLPMLAALVSGTDILLVTPKMKWGSVRELLDSSHFKEGLPEIAVAFIIADVLRALDYLHAKVTRNHKRFLIVISCKSSCLSPQGIVHRSVKAVHILLSETGSAYLTGLKYSCSIIDDGREHFQDRYDYPLHAVEGNLEWLSPELLQQVSKRESPKQE